MDNINECIYTHEGQHVRKIRQILDLNQKGLADKMGVSQQTISNIENTPVLDDRTRVKVAKAMGVPIELIKNFDQSSIINIIADNTFSGEGSGSQIASSKPVYNQNTYPIERIIEIFGNVFKEESNKTDLVRKQLEEVKEVNSILQQQNAKLLKELKELKELMGQLKK